MSRLISIHRLEFPLPIAYLCYAGWGACFAGRPTDPVVPLAIAANLGLILGALALNAAVDVGTDRRHPDKSHTASAVLAFGRTRTLRWAAAETGTGLAMALTVSALTGRWVVAGIATASVLLQLLYNVEPIRLKRRGFAGPAVFGVALVALPFLLSCCATRGAVEAPVWPILGGLTVLAVGRTVWWSLPDRAADLATGITTPTVRYGIARAVSQTRLILLAGLVLLAWGLWWRYGPVWVMPGIAAHAVFLAALPRSPPNAIAQRRRGMSLVTLGELGLVAVAVLA
jgi:4-hydroxybenzoate polyprenyltransferase